MIDQSQTGVDPWGIVATVRQRLTHTMRKRGVRYISLSCPSSPP